MSEWLIDLLKIVLGAGTIGAAWAGWTTYQKARYGQKRQIKGDEIAVLQGHIEHLREDRDRTNRDMGRELGKRDKELNEIRSDHTACKVNLERVQTENKYLTKRVDDLEKRLTAHERDKDREEPLERKG
jgi:chromosome segregation ATPase